MDSVKHDIEEFGELEGVDEEVRAKMLAGNAMNFYQVAV
jgi:hypothetical protein